MGEITDIIIELCLDLPILCALTKLVPISKPPLFANQLPPSATLLARLSSLTSPSMSNLRSTTSSIVPICQRFSASTQTHLYMSLKSNQHLRHHMFQHQFLQQKETKIYQPPQPLTILTLVYRLASQYPHLKQMTTNLDKNNSKQLKFHQTTNLRKAM